MGLSAVENNPLYFGIAGAYGDQAANDALLLADTVLLLGCRVSDRASGAFFTRKDKPSVIHIDIDPAEIGKNEKVDVPIVGDLKDCLSELLSGAESLPTEEFLNLLSSKKEKKILRNSKEGFLDPKEAIALLSKEVPNDAVLISDIGKNLFWSAKNFEIKGNRRFLTAGGLGTMGYSLPAGIGALYACDREIYVTLGDGALQMCLSELSTLRSSGKKLIIILFNNHALGMVKGLQKTAEYENFGVDLSDNIDFCRLAEVYSFGAERASSLLEFKEALKIARESDKTFFIECMIEKNED